MAAVKAPGASAVLVNVWATWCEPCREEMPDLVRFYREHRAQGLRLVLVSADDEDQRARGRARAGRAGLRRPAFIKRGDDMAFIDALDPQLEGRAARDVPVRRARRAAASPGTGSVTYDDLRAARVGPADKRKKPMKHQRSHDEARRSVSCRDVAGAAAPGRARARAAWRWGRRRPPRSRRPR